MIEGKTQKINVGDYVKYENSINQICLGKVAGFVGNNLDQVLIMLQGQENILDTVDTNKVLETINKIS